MPRFHLYIEECVGNINKKIRVDIVEFKIMEAKLKQNINESLFPSERFAYDETSVNSRQRIRDAEINTRKCETIYE